MSGIHQPPKPTPCPDCGYPRYDLDGACPGCETPRDDLGRFAAQVISSNVRVKRATDVPQSAMVLLRRDLEVLTSSAYGYRSTGDKALKESMLQTMYRISEHVQRLIIEREGEPS